MRRALLVVAALALPLAVFFGAGLVAGCSGSGAVAEYTNDNGARGPEKVRLLPWNAAPAPCDSCPTK